MRLAYTGLDGTASVCSLWYFYDDGYLWAASHKNAHIIKVLKNNPIVGFEIATNDYPYKGVRGKASVTLSQTDSATVLKKLINRYLADSNRSLAEWLMNRSDDEYCIKLTLSSINAWDFSDRMQA